MSSEPQARRSEDVVRSRMALAMLGGLVAVYLAWQVVEQSGDAEARYGDLFFPVIDLIGVGTAYAASLRVADVPPLRRFWRMMALSLLVLTAADTAQAIYDFASDDPPYPSLADGLYLVFYPLTFATIVGLPAPQGVRSQKARAYLDSAIVIVGVFTVAWYFALGPEARDATGSTFESIVTVAYPMGDLIVFAAVVGAYVRRCPPVLRAPLRAVGLGFLLFVVADVVTGYGSLHGTYASGDPIDVVYLLAAVALASAGLLQRPARPGRPEVATPSPPSLSARPNVLPYVSMFVAFGLLLAEFWKQPFFPGLSLIILAIYAAVLVSLRQYLSQQETAQLQRRMALILGSMGEGVITFTESGRILSANRAAEDAFLAHPDQLVGMRMESLLRNVDWDQRGANLVAARGRGESMIGSRHLLRGRRLDGATFPLEFVVSEVRIDGEQVFIGVGQDVSERMRTERELRESEQRFHTVFDNAGVGIVVIDLANPALGPLVVDANTAFAEMVGYEVDELRGDSIALVSHPVDNVMNDEHLRAWLMHGTAGSFQRDIPYVQRGGSVMWGNITFSAIRSESGAAVYVIGVLEDITQRRRMEQVKDEFVSVVGHELRTPLTSIRGSLGLLEAGVMGELPPEAGEMVSMAVSNTDRLVRLINDMLDIERMDAGRAEMQLEPVAAADLIEQSRQAVGAAAQDATVGLRISVDDGLVVAADPDRIVQALVNLIGNAIKFSDPTGTVEISAVRMSGPDLGPDVARFTVRDAGRGIPAAELESIFERFHQVDSSDARDKGGTGLGLPIARGIVEHHGGRMWAESPPGEGAAFHFTLPLTTHPDPPVELLVCGPQGTESDHIAALVADLDCRAQRAFDLQEALEAIATRSPAAVIVPADAHTGRWAAGVATSCAARSIPVVAMGRDAPPQDLVDGLSAWVEEEDGVDGLRSALRLVVPALRQGTVLVVEDDPDLGALLTRVLAREGADIRLVRTAAEAIQAIRQSQPSLVILDLILPGDDGYTVVERLRGEGLLAGIPLLVYSALHLLPGDRERLQLGRTEFLMKSETSPQDLERHVARLLWRVADPLRG